MNSWYKYSQESSDQLPPTQEQIDRTAKNLIQAVRRLDWFTDPQYKYSFYQYQLAIDNEPELSDAAWTWGEDGYDAVMATIEKELLRQEEAIFERRKKNLQEQGPLAHIEAALKGKSWEAAKREIALMLPMGTLAMDSKRRFSDEEAEGFFQRLYQTIYGAGYTDLEMLREISPYLDEEGNRYLVRVSDLEAQDPREPSDNEFDYSAAMFLRYNFGWDAKKAPEFIEIYRGVSRADAELRPGEYCTTNRDMARGYLRGKKGAILRQKVRSRDLLVMHLSNPEAPEFVYYPEGAETKAAEEVAVPITLRELWEKVNS